MAKMIPDTPRECNAKSHEVEMFRELEKLSDDYYVFHSFEIVSIILSGISILLDL